MISRPSHACLMFQAALNALCDNMEAEGCEIKRDNEAGTIVATHDGEVVLRAIHKGHKQPWIVMYYNSPFVTWSRRGGDQEHG